MQIIFFLSSFHEVSKCTNPTQYHVTLSLKGLILELSHTHLDHVPKKTDVRMRNPEKHSHAHCLSFEKKKNPTLNDVEHSRYIWQERIEKETRKTKRKKYEQICSTSK